MSVQVEKLEQKDMIKLTVEVSAEEFEEALQEAYNKQKKDISMPGFRKGKVPRVMIEKTYGPQVFYEEAYNSLLAPAYYDAVKECGEDIVSRPVIDIIQIEKGKPFIFTAEVAVKPDIELGEYKGIEVTEADIEVTEDEINKTIERERNSNARMVTVEDRAVEEGDTVVIDFDGYINDEPFEGGQGENYNLEIGSGTFIPGFEEQLIGANTGDEIDVNAKFPEDYHAEELQGQPAVFKVKIHEIKAKELPEVDDEFAQDISEFDTLEEYKQSIVDALTEQKKAEAKENQSREALTKIIAASGIDLPEPMVDGKVDDMINQFTQQLGQQGLSMEQYMQFSGGSMDDLREQIRPEAVQGISADLVLAKVAEVEGIEITEDDLNAELDTMADVYGVERERLEEILDEEYKEAMRQDLAAKRAMDIIYDSAKFVPAPPAEEAEEADEDIAEEAAEAAEAAETADTEEAEE